MRLRNVVIIALLLGVGLTFPGRKCCVTATLKAKKDSDLSNWQEACISEIDGNLEWQFASVDLHYAISMGSTDALTVTFYLDQAEEGERVHHVLTSLKYAVCDDEVKIDKDFFISD